MKSISKQWGLALLLMVLTIFCGGCSHKTTEKNIEQLAPAVEVVRPAVRTIDCELQQPGFVNAFEQTSIFSKVSGFIKAYYVDIGQEVHKGQALAEIFVPELNEQVTLDKSMVEQANQLVVVARRSVENAEAQLAEAKANVGRYEADVVRWQSEVERLTRMVQERVVDKDILTETQRQLDSSIATKTAAEAAVRAREADRLMAEASLGKASIDVKVAEAGQRKAEALLDYTQLTAPYDGIVTVRNANTGDFVQAVTGDKATTSPSAIYVVERTDKLRVFVDVPENYAAYVQPGTQAAIRANGLSGMDIRAPVTRTSWSIVEKTRTLRTEIDLTKDQYDGLRPGRYVYVSVFVHRPDVYALPQQALMVTGNQTYCFLVKSGKAVRTPINTALSDGKWVEVDRLKFDDSWVKVDGEQEMIVGDLSDLTDGQAVRVAPAAAR